MLQLERCNRLRKWAGEVKTRPIRAKLKWRRSARSERRQVKWNDTARNPDSESELHWTGLESQIWSRNRSPLKCLAAPADAQIFQVLPAHKKSKEGKGKVKEIETTFGIPRKPGSPTATHQHIPEPRAPRSHPKSRVY